MAVAETSATLANRDPATGISEQLRDDCHRDLRAICGTQHHAERIPNDGNTTTEAEHLKAEARAGHQSPGLSARIIPDKDPDVLREKTASE